jgi:hypothetical protein
MQLEPSLLDVGFPQRSYQPQNSHPLSSAASIIGVRPERYHAVC